MKRLLHFGITLLFTLIVIPATEAASSRAPAGVIERIPGAQCQNLVVGVDGTVVKFNHVPAGDLVVHSTNPDNWKTSNGTRSCDIGVVWKRSFIPHNGVTLYEENCGSPGITYDSRLYRLPLADYDRVLHSPGALSIADHTVLEGGKPLLKLGAPGAAVRVSDQIDLQIDVPDNFSGLITIMGGRNCAVDFDQLHNCSIGGVLYDTSITARELSNLKSLDLLASSSTVHLQNVSTDLLRMGDASVRYPSKFCIDSGAAKRGCLSGLEEDFKLIGDFSALKNNWSPIAMPHRNTPKPTY